MKIEQIKDIIENYEILKDDLSHKANELVKLGLITPSPFFHGSWSFNSINFEAQTIEFVDDDFYNGYDLHDMAYRIVPLSLFMEKK